MLDIMATLHDDNVGTLGPALTSLLSTFGQHFHAWTVGMHRNVLTRPSSQSPVSKKVPKVDSLHCTPRYTKAECKGQ